VLFDRLNRVAQSTAEQERTAGPDLRAYAAATI
jgi:hypothetical protein